MIIEEMKATFDLQGTIKMLKTWAKMRSVHSNGFHQASMLKEDIHPSCIFERFVKDIRNMTQLEVSKVPWYPLFESGVSPW